MKKQFLPLLMVLLLLLVSCGEQRQGPPKLLVFSKTMGFKHASIPTSIAAIQKLAAEQGMEVDTTKNAELFTDENLQHYSAIIFLSTTGDVLNHRQEAAFERYIQAGGGFVGVHAATDTEYDWGWYAQLVGGQFQSHPAGTPEADFIVKDKTHPSTEFFTDTLWHRTDELYNFKRLNPDVKVLVTVDESTYEGGANGAFHPMAWYHEYDGGRAFYTAGGHTDESYSEELFLKHLLGGIQYAIGSNAVLDYSRVTSQIPPEANRFSKKVLSLGKFFEPTEMTVLPNKDVLIVQRRGEVLLYKDATGELSEIAKLDVYHKTLNTPGVNAEEGLMGLQKDPNFEQNRWVYMYYAPTGDKWVNRLSRFKFENDALDMASEQVILEVDSQREICCHTGGSIAFGPKGLLYLSTGDNSTPFDEEGAKYVNRGYAPLNDLPGKQQYDARRSSGNTNDLRGKILRIKVNEDGSYDIPEGNLFPVGMEKTRPEIYTMGHRNPYRISVDMKRGYLYWGDVGPDAGADSLMTRGPRGYDEMNQARGPGNFGWPLFIGDNFAYRDYDYGTGVHGEPFDPERPINDSENNTGLRELPPAQPAYMYYPYADTQDFPQVGSGGRNAMAGPTYWSELFTNGGGLPAYYDGKVIIYEWMRGWMMAVHLFEDGSFNKVEPFASDIKVNSLIDMELGPDGRLYLLEYGSGWFSANSDSSLGYVEFNGGNRPPVIDGLLVDADSGSLPLTVTATVEAHDREGDAITYLWDMGDGTTKETTDPKLTHEYTTKGDYTLRVTAKDAQGEEVQSTPQGIVVGNNRPQVKIAIQQANASFYVPGKPIDYTVTVNDPDGEVNEDNVYVSVEYRTGMDAANTNLGHQQVAASVTGKALTQSLDCKACHKEKDASIGPSYRAISKKYKGQQRAVDYVMTKIVNGGSGVWGEVTMPAHPTVTEDEARQMALYIQSLSGDDTRKPTLPMSGSVTPETSQGGKTLLLTASYTDEGVEGTMPLTGSNTVVLKSNTLSFPEETEVEGMQPVAFNGMDLLLVTAPHGWWRIPEIDMTGVSAVVVTIGWQAPPSAGYTFEVREGTPTGTLLGTGEMPTPSAGQPAGMAMIPIAQPTEKVEGLYILFKANGVADVPVAIINATFN